MNSVHIFSWGCGRRNNCITLCSLEIIKLTQAHNIFPVIRDNANKTHWVGDDRKTSKKYLLWILTSPRCLATVLLRKSNFKLTSMFWEYWKVSHFWQIESETLEVRQIFARAHYFVLFVKRKQQRVNRKRPIKIISWRHHNFQDQDPLIIVTSSRSYKDGCR